MCRATSFHWGLFHRWDKWQQYEETGTAVVTWGKAAGRTYPYSESRQRRTCFRCGKVQDKKI